jgi:uncharacterized protein (DUF4415 family)
MSKHRPKIDLCDEVRELNADHLHRFKPTAHVLPALLHAKWVVMNRTDLVRVPQKAPYKQATTLRMLPEVMSAFKAAAVG